MDDLFQPDGADGLVAAPPRRYEPPPSVIWRFVGVPLLFLAVVGIFALFSYDAADVAALQAPPSRVAANWMGRLGALLAYGAILFFGLVGFLLPLALGAIALMMLFGRPMRWRPLWMLGLGLSLCALAQFPAETLLPLLSSERLNAAPNAGGGVGRLLAAPAVEWLGAPGAAAVFGALAVLFLLLLVGFGNIAAAWRAHRERRDRQLEAAEDAALASRTDLEADDLARVQARREERDRRRADREAREAAREREAAEKARLRDEARAAKEAERERRRAEKDAEKARRREEKEARRRAKDEGVDDLVAGGLAPLPPQPGVAPAPAPAAEPIAAPPAPAPAAARRAPAPTLVAPPDLDEAAAPAEEAPPPVEFHLPTTRLLHELPPETAFDNSAEVAERSRVIEDTLAEFQLPGAVTHVVCGPTITRYEVKPEAGVKVDRIQGVHRNLQMNLRAKSLRIVAPIPGKDVVGIEVPNIKSRPVPLRGIAESPEWRKAAREMALPMLLSRDIDGSPVIADLATMPHMIVAGTTGSGKSVTLNGILAGWLLTRTPDQLRLVLVDPKRVEFTPYADIPHLVVPVITEAPKVAVCLQWAVKEMDKRLKLFQKTGVRNIAAYNARPKEASLFGDDEPAPADEPATLPYIAIVIDEMSDLMMLAGADVEPRVVRLAQLARAVGIHLIIATQRPDVKVITGKIKANFPARIALKVSSATDSITIIDQGGAQSLIGRGDMLFLNPTSSAGLQRSQSCWIDDDEIAALTQWYRDQSGPMYVPDIKAKLDKIKVKDAGDDFKTFEADDDGAGGGEEGGEESGADGETAFLQKCLDTLVAADRASTSMLQRKLRLGYNKAARVIDQLEQLGCLGPANGSAPREILRSTVRDPSAGPADDAGGGDDDFPDDAGDA